MRSTTPLIGIIDDTDAPEARNLVVIWGHPARRRVEYINRDIRPIGCKFARMGQFTDIREFGVDVLFEEDGALQTNAHKLPGRARYPDGAPRRWQDRRSINAIAVRPMLAGHVMKAVQAMRAERKGKPNG